MARFAEFIFQELLESDLIGLDFFPRHITEGAR